jgi:hypothetical protein
MENWRRRAKFPFALGPKNSLGDPATMNGRDCIAVGRNH